MAFHPIDEMRLFSGTFRVSKLAWNKTPAHRETGVGGEHHVGKFGTRWNKLHFAIKSRKRLKESFPLCLNQRGVRAPRSTHPRVNFVLDPVVVRWTKQQFTHKRRQSF